MAPTPAITTITPILNTTCVALHTFNFTIAPPSTTNLTAICSLPPLKPPKHISFSPLLVIPIICGVKVERLFAYYHDLEHDERFNKGPGGRIQDVKTEVNDEEMTRTIIATEDLTKEPGARKISRGESMRIERSRSRGRSQTVRPLPPLGRADQIPSLPLAADRSAWPEAPRPPTPPSQSVGAIAPPTQTMVRFEMPAGVCSGACGEVPDMPPPAYQRRE
ncbi:hypothetical protein ONS95_010644 [Cadophora gregata]|uniref:uncharacterized protein n=1 Tax=Cadophora gregata TaxID=51156 RepID=UPI0026DCFC3C|nr:uncharacterized protein ONS95_010644 [Cadophora gregata]KAK0122405.1 hypothetical protein ONS95_010644 [Cadophora gregata]KAK0127884.1 hypothetical protein ONS96_007384 [Cadophora gregata f. sp. sojae]